jgi:hypothetical protein
VTTEVDSVAGESNFSTTEFDSVAEEADLSSLKAANASASVSRDCLLMDVADSFGACIINSC